MNCPTCKQRIEWEDNPFRPFCSERCKLVDLGKWISEEYRVPGKDNALQVTNEENEEQPESPDRA